MHTLTQEPLRHHSSSIKGGEAYGPERPPAACAHPVIECELAMNSLECLLRFVSQFMKMTTAPQRRASDRAFDGARLGAGARKERFVVRTFSRQPPVDHLRSLDQFLACSKTQLRTVMRLAEHLKTDQGKILVREGQNGQELFLILSGSVEVTQSGRRVNELGRCDFFGELAALTGAPRNATVTTLSELEFLVIGPREFNAMAEIPGFRDALFKKIASRLRHVDARLAADRADDAVGVAEAQFQGVCPAGPSWPFLARSIMAGAEGREEGPVVGPAPNASPPAMSWRSDQT